MGLEFPIAAAPDENTENRAVCKVRVAKDFL
jgi:hypothetical protein